jgi:hypothetical protein
MFPAVALLVVAQAAADLALPSTLDCGIGALKGNLPPRSGDATLLRDVRKVFVVSENDQGARQHIVSVLRREEPGLEVIERLADADAVLAFETLGGASGFRSEAIGGWGRGCIYRQGLPGVFVLVAMFSNQGDKAEVHVGRAFAETFVTRYRKANAER